MAAEEREKVLQVKVRGEASRREEMKQDERRGGSLTGHVLLMRSSSPIRSCFTADQEERHP